MIKSAPQDVTIAHAEAHAGAGGGATLGSLPREVIDGLDKLRCLPGWPSKRVDALRGPEATEKGETSAQEESGAMGNREVVRLLQDVGMALLDQARLLQGQREREEVCPALRYLSIRCFAAIEMLHQVGSCASPHLVPDGEAMWGPMVEAWSSVRAGPGPVEGVLADLTRWWLDRKARGVAPVPFGDVSLASAAGNTAITEAVTSLGRQASWLRGSAAGPMQCEAAANQIDLAACAVQRFQGLVGSAGAVDVDALPREDGLNVPDELNCFTGKDACVFSSKVASAGSESKNVEKICQLALQLRSGSEALAQCAGGVAKAEAARIALGLPRFAQVLQSVAFSSKLPDELKSYQQGVGDVAAVQMHGERCWPLSRMLEDEAWGEVDSGSKELLCAQVFGSLAFAEVCGVKVDSACVADFVVVGLSTCSVGSFVESLRSRRCHVLLSACSKIWAGHAAGFFREKGAALARAILGAGTGSEGTIQESTSFDDSDSSAWRAALSAFERDSIASFADLYALVFLSCKLNRGSVESLEERLRASGARSMSMARQQMEHSWAAQESSFITACRTGDVALLRQLLALEGDEAVGVHASIAVELEAAFCWACHNGHLCTVRELLGLTGKREVDVHAGSRFGSEAGFRLACREGHVEVVKELLALKGRREIDVHAGDDDGFQLACKRSHVAVVRELLRLEGGRAIDLRADGDQWLRWACDHCSFNVVCELLTHCTALAGKEHAQHRTQGSEESSTESGAAGSATGRDSATQPLLDERVARLESSARDGLSLTLQEKVAQLGRIVEAAAPYVHQMDHGSSTASSEPVADCATPCSGKRSITEEPEVGFESKQQQAAGTPRISVAQTRNRKAAADALVWTSEEGRTTEATAISPGNAFVDESEATTTGTETSPVYKARSVGAGKNTPAHLRIDLRSCDRRAHEWDFPATPKVSSGLSVKLGLGQSKFKGLDPEKYMTAIKSGNTIAPSGDPEIDDDHSEVPVRGDSDTVSDHLQAAQQGDATEQVYLGVMYKHGRGVAKDECEAVRWFSAAAGQGLALGQTKLGIMLRTGVGVSKNESEAVRWFKAAAEQGHAAGQVNLGDMYRYGKGVGKDVGQAVRWYRAAAEQGHPRGQINLGRMYASGRGVPKNESEAVRWYRAAADQGHAKGQVKLGRMLEFGTGVAKDEAEAVRWYRAAAEQGDARGQVNLGIKLVFGSGVAKDDAEAVRWLRAAAEQGHAHGQGSLGTMYEYGRGVEQDEAEAVRWYRAAAEQGDALGQCNLANMYEFGKGVEKDDAEAVRWYTEAAGKGVADAQCYLGTMYSNGWGVDQDEVQAVRWYRAAAAQGHTEGLCNLGDALAHGIGVEQDETEAVRCYEEAAGQGDSDGQCNLGIMYEYGRGVEKNEAMAAELYSAAALQGNELGQYYLGTMYEHGSGVAKDEAEAVHWYRAAAEQGHADGQVSLGTMYEEGRGVEMDEGEALRWYKAAAEQGNGLGQCKLGMLYEYGKGVEKDEGEALKWYTAAAEPGDEFGQWYLGIMYSTGRGVEVNEAEAVRWFSAAAEQGHADGQCDLGLMLEFGKGVEKDHIEAAMWYREAADQGHAHGQCYLGTMHEHGKGVDQDFAEAAKWYRAAAEQGHAGAQCLLGKMYSDGRGVEQDDVEAAKWFKQAAVQEHAEGQCLLGMMYSSGRGVEQDDAEAVRWYKAAAEQGDELGQFCLAKMLEHGTSAE